MFQAIFRLRNLFLMSKVKIIAPTNTQFSDFFSEHFQPEHSEFSFSSIDISSLVYIFWESLTIWIVWVICLFWKVLQTRPSRWFGKLLQAIVASHSAFCVGKVTFFVWIWIPETKFFIISKSNSEILLNSHWKFPSKLQF